MVPYRPGQSEALGKFPNHGKLQTVLESAAICCKPVKE